MLFDSDPSKFLRPDKKRAAQAPAPLSKGMADTTAPELDLWYEQAVDGVPVQNGRVGVHLDPTGKEVWAVTNSYRPGLENAPTKPSLTADEAVTEARRALPQGRPAEKPQLLLRPGATEADNGSQLVWRVWLLDDKHGVSNEYYVDARTGRGILDVENRHRYEQNRRVYDYVHSEDDTLPAQPSRVEGGQLSGTLDVNQAYDYTGATYKYFMNHYGQDSYDN
ncbi:hypothetical protein [Streptomyces sp. NPDC058307]|uniref:hypothetical protein n=1 Tax=Streptomyces sp. NPDC058307 TaxID=3346439 RepID=UPI0036E3BB07